MSWYRAVMDPERNPLAKLPAAQRFQIMTVLSVMWTTIFCASLGVWMLYGQLIVAHILVLLGVLFTSLTFRTSEHAKATYSEYSRAHRAGRHHDGRR